MEYKETIYKDQYGNIGKLRKYKKLKSKNRKYRLKKRLLKVIAVGLSIVTLIGVGKFLFKGDKDNYVDYDNTTTSSISEDDLHDDSTDYFNYNIESGEDDIIAYKQLTKLNVRESDIKSFKNYLNNNPVNYKYDDLYNIEKAYNNYKPNIIKTPTNSVLLINGVLNADALYNRVLENNDNYYNDTKNNTAKSFYNELKNKEIKEICNVITEVINSEVKKEDLNILDVCKNLEHLKIFEDKAAFNNARVNDDMCLSVNKRFIEKIFKVYNNGKDCYDEVIVHEIMHLIQYMTSDLNKENGVEIGPFVSYVDSNEVNPFNLTWILESNAEVEMSEYTGSEITTYSTQVGYLNSVNLALSSSYLYSTNGINTISYEKDWDAIYDMFGAKTDNKKKDVIRCLYSIEVSQVADKNFYDAYNNKYKKNIENDNDLKQEVKKSCAKDALLELSRVFYRNMCDNLNGKDFYLEDVFYLIRLWEADLLYHLDYNLEEQYLSCKDFIDYYNGIQNEFFEMLAKSLNCTCDEIYEEYNNYSMNTNKGDNYKLNNFDNSKKDFLLKIKQERYEKGNPRISSIDSIMQNKKELNY